MVWQIPVGILVAILLWAALNYNALVRGRQHVRESWADIDTELKRRYDLIPNLVAAVKGYAAHERETLEAVTTARERARNSHGSPGKQAADEKNLVAGLQKLLAVAEAYPDLKANANFLALQQELTNTEDRIQAARRFYNGNVRDLNTRIEVFPSNVIASLFRFRPEEFFEVESAVIRQVVDVSFGG
ncbi:MAG: LemA family protein [bacterium]|nr:LemA family protein [bacterium]